MCEAFNPGTFTSKEETEAQRLTESRTEASSLVQRQSA